MAKSWKFKNLTLLACAFVLSVFLGSNPLFQTFIFSHGMPVAFLAGILFISTFTCPIACAMLLVLAEKYPLHELWVIAATAAVISDFIFFNMVRDHVGDEIQPIYKKVFGKNHLNNILDTRHFRWLFPVIGAGVILSPLPKSMGLRLLGVHRISRIEFIGLSAFVNTIGIAFILLLSFIIKP